MHVAPAVAVQVAVQERYQGEIAGRDKETVCGWGHAPSLHYYTRRNSELIKVNLARSFIFSLPGAVLARVSAGTQELVS